MGHMLLIQVTSTQDLVLYKVFSGAKADREWRKGQGSKERLESGGKAKGANRG